MRKVAQLNYTGLPNRVIKEALSKKMLRGLENCLGEVNEESKNKDW